MLLSTFEKALTNNPLRVMLQRHVEPRGLQEMGGPATGRVLEIGCGRGLGTEIILTHFEAERGDAFDLVPQMVELARQRLKHLPDRVRFWAGDVTRNARNVSFDAVFDFGIIHHVPNWSDAFREIHRILRPGGRFYVDEVLRGLILNPLVRRLLQHPLENRFDHDGLDRALQEHGFKLLTFRHLGGAFGWYVADKVSAT